MSKKDTYHLGTMNKVILIGGLKEVPSLHQFEEGVMTKINLATRFTSYDAQNKSYCDKTEWHRVVVYDKLAEEVVRIGRPGMKLLVEGPIRRRDYTDAQHIEHSVYEVIATTLHSFSAIYKTEEDEAKPTPQETPDA